MTKNCDILSEETLQYIEKILEEDEKLKMVREKIQKAVDNSPKSVSFEQAKKQVLRTSVMNKYQNKKQVLRTSVMNKYQKRWLFREGVFERDNRKCKMCGGNEGGLDAHHITDRHEMPNGGYVLSNGITLCSKCHLDAEQYHITNGKYNVENFHPNDLYTVIGSSYEQAFNDSKNLEK